MDWSTNGFEKYKSKEKISSRRSRRWKNKLICGNGGTTLTVRKPREQREERTCCVSTFIKRASHNPGALGCWPLAAQSDPRRVDSRAGSCSQETAATGPCGPESHQQVLVLLDHPVQTGNETRPIPLLGLLEREAASFSLRPEESRAADPPGPQRHSETGGAVRYCLRVQGSRRRSLFQ